jgi:signal peptidase II
MLIEMTTVAASVIAADQASKAFVLSRPWAANSNVGFFSIRKQLSRRGAPIFALASRTLIGIWIASAAIAAALLQAGIIGENPLGAAGIGAALGGAAGNIADRLRHGAVVDFIVIGRWPPFNLADAAIVIGAGLLVLSFAKA